MAETSVHSDNTVKQWAEELFIEFVRESPFKTVMGTGPDAAIQINEDLETKPGDAVTFSLAKRLTGDGVEDGATLEGNEEQLINYGYRVTVHELRNAVVVGKYEKIKSAFDLWAAAKKLIKVWEQEKLRDLLIARMLCPAVDGTTTYAAATEVQKDAWETANNPTDSNQRILFGAAKANSTLDHSAGLLTIDGTADDLHQDIVRLGKRLLQSANPKVRPAQSNKDPGKERFFHFVGSLAFRDLAANMDAVLQNADMRGDENQIFSGGMLKINNVVVMELPELDRTPANGGSLLSGVGAGGIDVSASFMLGAQAVLLAWAQRPQIIMDERDYKNKRGVATEEIRGAAKATFNSVQHGMGTIYVSAVGD